MNVITGLIPPALQKFFFFIFITPRMDCKVLACFPILSLDLFKELRIRFTSMFSSPFLDMKEFMTGIDGWRFLLDSTEPSIEFPVSIAGRLSHCIKCLPHHCMMLPFIFQLIFLNQRKWRLVTDSYVEDMWTVKVQSYLAVTAHNVNRKFFALAET